LKTPFNVKNVKLVRFKFHNSPKFGKTNLNNFGLSKTLLAYFCFLFNIIFTSEKIFGKGMKKRIVIFASGSGTNAENIINYFQRTTFAAVILVLSNRKEAKVLERAKSLNVNAIFFTKEELFSEEGVLKILKKTKPDLIVLAGFLLKFPEIILKEFPDKVINVHPALLPKYGGKGMYGNFVHEAILKNKELETGITIHYVNENYDEGAIILQKKISLSEIDSAETIAEKVHKLEYEWFPKVIEEVLREKTSTPNPSFKGGEYLDYGE